MTDAEILNKVILLAEERGFKGRIDTLYYEKPNSTDLSYGKDIKLCEPAIYLNTYQGILFSHQFAKAFWGEKNICAHCEKIAVKILTGEEIVSDCCHEPVILMWQYHLQQMVIKAEPIKYMQQFI